MTAIEPRSDAVLLLAGAVVAASGLAAAAALLDVGRPVLLPLSEVGLAVGTVILVVGRSGIVGASRSARGALLLFGVGPLLHLLEPAPGPWSVLVGTATIGVITIATVVSAVLVARAGRVHGVARWALLLVAADALLTAVMSSVPAEGLVLAYLAGHLELIRPLSLLAWGAALTVRSPAVRRGASTIASSWRRTTDVGGAGRPGRPSAALMPPSSETAAPR